MAGRCRSQPVLPLFRRSSGRSGDSIGQVYREQKGQKSLAFRCTFDSKQTDSTQTIGQRLQNRNKHLPEKAYSDYLEFYVGLLLKASQLDRGEVWNTLKRIITVGAADYTQKCAKTLFSDTEPPSPPPSSPPS